MRDADKNRTASFDPKDGGNIAQIAHALKLQRSDKPIVRTSVKWLKQI